MLHNNNNKLRIRKQNNMLAKTVRHSTVKLCNFNIINMI